MKMMMKRFLDDSSEATFSISAAGRMAGKRRLCRRLCISGHALWENGMESIKSYPLQPVRGLDRSESLLTVTNYCDQIPSSFSLCMTILRKLFSAS